MKMQIYLTRLSKGWMQASSFASGSKTFKCLLSLTRLSKGWMQASLLCVRLEDFCPEVVNCHKMGREGVLRGALVPSSLLSGRAADVTSGAGGIEAGALRAAPHELALLYQSAEDDAGIPDGLSDGFSLLRFYELFVSGLLFL